MRIALIVAASFLLFVAVAVGVTEWFVYWMADAFGPCFLESAHGGRSASGFWAALIGLALFAPAVLAASRWRRMILPLLVGFALVYGALLVGLWYASPMIWGPERCTATPF
jgi:hypothetical protein